MLFLSHSGQDTEDAKSLASLLREAGVEVWLDVERLQPGNRWMEELEKALRVANSFAVYVGKSGVQRWVDREVRIALERNTENPNFRVFPILGPGANLNALPLFLNQHQRLDLSAGFSSPAQIKGLISAILDVPSERVALLPPGKPPFLGLHAFDVEDALLFYGRDREIEELLQRLQKQRFLAVVGDSGSGKSSLVRAGLIPSLIRGRFHDGQRWTESWRVAIMRPADDPFRELVNALPDLDAYGQVRNDVRRACERDLREGTTGLYNSVASLVKPGDRTLVLVDQFEELFTLERQTEHDEDKRKVRDQQNRFIDCLLTAADAGGDRSIYVVITLRADFYAHCWQHAQLPRRIAANQYAVQRIPTEKLREVIETPLSLAGAKAEPGLVRTILEDMGDAPGSLPLLEHALELLWDARTDHTLTHAAYESLGRLKGAIRKYADKVYGELSRDEQAIAEKVLLRLTQLGEGTEYTRRTARVNELFSMGSDPGLTQEVVKRLADARLVTVGGDISSTQAGGSNDTTVDIAHETLIREWPALRSWIEKNRDALRTSRRLETAARDWKQKDGRSDYLYRGGRLVEAEEWAGKQDVIPDDVREFLEASKAAALEESEAQQREIIRQKELREEADRSAVRSRRFSYALAGLFLCAVGAAIFARSQQLTAESRALASQAEQVVSLDSSAALDIALRGWRIAKTSEANLAVADAFPQLLSKLEGIAGHSGVVGSAAFSPDGQRMISTASWDRIVRVWNDVAFSPDDQRIITAGWDDRIVRVWNAASGQLLCKLEGHSDAVFSAAFSPDGQRIVTASDDRTARVWNAASGQLLSKLEGHSGAVYDAAFSPDGQRIITASWDDRTARVWNAASGQLLSKLGDVFSAAFLPDGQRIVTASRDGTVRVWNAASGQLLSKLESGDVFRAAFSPNGQRIVTASRDHTARVWNTASGQLLSKLAGHSDAVNSTAFSPDGQSIVTASDDRTARVWNAASGQLLCKLEGHSDAVLSAAFSRDGQRIVTASADTTARVWNTASGQLLCKLEGHSGVVESAAFSPDGQRIVTASADTTARVWNTTSGQLLCKLEGHSRIVNTAAFSPDGRRIVTASDDGTARVWNAASGQLLCKLEGHSAAVWSAAFSPDGQRIVTASRDGTARVYRVITLANLAELLGK